MPPTHLSIAMTPLTREAAPAQAQPVTFEALYDAHYEQVYYRALRYAGGRQAWAEDITQEVFITLMEHLHTLDPTRDAAPWLMRVTTNKSLNKLKREALWSHKLMPRWLSQQREQDTIDPEALTGAREELVAIYEAVYNLPPKQRVALLLHRVDGLTLEQVGQEMGHSKGYISKLIQRAEAKLKPHGGSRHDD